MKIISGNFYLWTKGVFVRQVIGITDNQVHYRDFDYKTGEPFSSHSVCSLSYFEKSVVRVLTTDEACRMQIKRSDCESKDEMKKIKALLMASCSDEELLREVHHRGLLLSN